LDRDALIAGLVLLALGVLAARAAQRAQTGPPVTGPGAAAGPTPHFTWVELAVTSTGLPNTPTPEARANLTNLARTVLEPLRAATGDRPIIVSSGYRSPQVNAAIAGSAHDSQHLRGEAADIRSNHVSSETLAAYAVELGLPYDQLIWYHPARGGHVHVSAVIGRPPRREVRYQPETGRTILVESAVA
jgi:zinc D-Ala-D-Ala carboxypeptidase